MAASLEDYLDFYTGSSLKVQRATSRHLSALHPMFPEGGLVDPATGLKVKGIYIGECGPGGVGGNFYYDVYQLYQAHILHNLNVVLLGEIDHRKSSLLKTYIIRLVAYGYSVLVTDIKGEYDPIAAFIEGSKVLRFGNSADGESLCINPLDSRIEIDDQAELIALLAVRTMGSEYKHLSTSMRGVLEAAIRAVHERYVPDERGLNHGQPTLPDLVAKLKDPDDYMVEKIGLSKQQMKDLGFDMAISLQKLTEGKYGSMCSGPTTPGLYEHTPFLSMNVRDVPQSMLPVVTTIYNFFISSQFGSSNALGRFTHVIHDEAWRLAADDAFVSSLVQSHKLGRTEGVSNITAFHHLNTLYRSGENSAVKELVVDSGTRIIYAQDDTEVEQTAHELNLTDHEQALIPDQPPGHGLWKIGKDYSVQVKHIAFPFEIPLLETSHRVKGLAA